MRWLFHLVICNLLGFRWNWKRTISDADSRRRRSRTDLALYECSRCGKTKIEPFTRRFK